MAVCMKMMRAIVIIASVTDTGFASFYPPLVPPVEQYKTFTLTLDRATLGNVRHYVWRDILNGSGGESAPYRSVYWLCFSLTESGYGAGDCLYPEPQTAAPTSLTLRFTEQRTRVTRDIRLYAQSTPVGCTSAPTGINSFNNFSCFAPGQGVVSNYAKSLSVWFDEQALNTLPFGGLWQATLQLRQRNLNYDMERIDWQANIDLTLRDGANATVWFPQQQTSTPRHDLALKTHQVQTIPGGVMDGRAQLDMCLYDGINNYATRYSLTVTDDEHIGNRRGDVFSVFHKGINDNTLRRRIDYHIQLSYNGQEFYMDNNVKRELPSLNFSQLRPVQLPGIPTPVLCAPAPLTFITPQFNKRDKESGDYQGSVRVIFTPTL